jgi:hypothetical protein
MQMEKANVALYQQLNTTTSQRAALCTLWREWCTARETSQRAFVAAVASAASLPSVAAVPAPAIAAVVTAAAGSHASQSSSDRWATRLVGPSAAATARAAAALSALRDELRTSSMQFAVMASSINNAHRGFTVDQAHWLIASMLDSTSLDASSFTIDTFRLCQLASEEAKHESRRSICAVA